MISAVMIILNRGWQKYLQMTLSIFTETLDASPFYYEIILQLQLLYCTENWDFESEKRLRDQPLLIHSFNFSKFIFLNFI